MRLGFASAIQADADVYLVDEVLAVGDIRFQQKCFDTFRRLKREGRTVVFVGHDLATVERFCDRVLLLEQGDAVASASRTTSFSSIEDGHSSTSGRTDAGGRIVRWGDGAAEILEACFEDDVGRPSGRSSRVVGSPSASCPLSPRHGEPDLRRHRANRPSSRSLRPTRSQTPSELGASRPVRGRVQSVLPGPSCRRSLRASPSAYEDGTPHADWREDLLQLRVNAVVPTLGVVDLPHEHAGRCASSRSGRRDSRAAGALCSRRTWVGTIRVASLPLHHCASP